MIGKVATILRLTGDEARDCTSERGDNLFVCAGVADADKWKEKKALRGFPWMSLFARLSRSDKIYGRLLDDQYEIIRDRAVACNCQFKPASRVAMLEPQRK